MIEALVQHDFDITLHHILWRMRTVTSRGEVVTVREGGETTRATYGEVARRANRLAGALHSLGVRSGDRVATFAWNSQEHLEAYLAIPCMGAVLHTLNIRLSDEQLVYIINHAEDRVILVDGSLVPQLLRVLPKVDTITHVIVIGDDNLGLLPGAHRYEDLVAAHSGSYDWPSIAGRSAASLCYTSGTTGNPRGVLYGHQSTVIHAMAQCLTDTMGIRSSDRVLPIVPMFHANAWGLPYACTMVGASLVMPGRFLQAPPIVDLIETESVTFAAAVPTIWMDILHTSGSAPERLRSLRRAIAGGAPAPETLMREFEATFGSPLIQGYGMTETSPLVAIAEPPGTANDDERWKYRTKTGRISPMVQARIVDDSGTELPWDGTSVGELELTGPWVASGYYLDDDATAEKMHDGWLRTGDITTITDNGYLQITDRAKDVVKSGGEWISSVEMENHLMSHSSVREAAVIAKPDDRWTERPLACVVVHDDVSVRPEELSKHLASRFARWQLPDEYAFIDEVPKTSVGKFDKKVLRRRLEQGELELHKLPRSGPEQK